MKNIRHKIKETATCVNFIINISLIYANFFYIIITSSSFLQHLTSRPFRSIKFCKFDRFGVKFYTWSSVLPTICLTNCLYVCLTVSWFDSAKKLQLLASLNNYYASVTHKYFFIISLPQELILTLVSFSGLFIFLILNWNIIFIIIHRLLNVLF